MILIIIIFVFLILCIPRKKCFYDPRDYKPLYDLHFYYEDIAREASQLSKVSTFKRDRNEWSEMDDPISFLRKLGKNDSWFHSWDTSDKPDGRDNWLNYHIIFYDKVVGNPAVCPLTINLLKNIKGIRIAGFSKLKAGTRLYPHSDTTGLSTNSLAYHLGLTGHAKFYMGGKLMKHAPGKMIIADTNNEHYVINDSDEDRIILYIDFDINNLDIYTPK